MSCIHYKFFSKLHSNTVLFDGPHISVCDLKRQIMQKEKLKAARSDLQIANAQTMEEFTDGNALIPKNSSVIVRRIPSGGGKSTRKTFGISRTEPGMEPAKATEASSGPRIRRSTGIPTSFMMEVKDPNTRGAMLTRAGKYAVPIIDAEAYAIGKKEKPPFLEEEPSPSSSSEKEEDPIPEELLCLICKDILTDAAVVPCCGNSYCDECIRTELLESDEHTCPTCRRQGVSPDALVANKCLRRAVDKFKNQTGPTRRLGKQLLPPPPPVPPPRPRPLGQRDPQPRMRCLLSRQQDPLTIPLTSSSAHPSPSLLPFTLGPSWPLAPCMPGNASPARATLPDSTVTVSTTEHPEKVDGPLRDSENQLLPAAALPSEGWKGASMAMTSLPAQEKGCQPPVLDTPSSWGQPSSQGQLISTTCPRRIKAACPGSGRPGWEHSNQLGYLVPLPEQVRSGEGGCPRRTERGRNLSQRSRRTPGPSRPGSPASVPAPPPPCFPLPPFRLSLPPGVAPPRFSHHSHPGQPPLEGSSVPQPGFSPAPAQMWTPWVPSGVQTAHADSMPTDPAPPLSRQEFFREQRRLKDEEKKRSKPVQFPKGNSEEQTGPRKIPEGLRRSFPRTASPCRGSSYARRSHTSCKSSCGWTRSCPSSPSFIRSHSGSYSGSSPSPRRGRGRSQNYRARSRAHGHYRSRSRSPSYSHRHLRS